MDNVSISNTNLRNAIYQAFEGKCFYTGQPVKKEDMAIDHVLPKIKGGKNNVYNYVLTSRRLNILKGTKFYSEKIDAVLFIVATVYAPKILRILNRYDEKRICKNIEDIEVKIAAAEENKGFYELVKALGELWISIRTEPSIFDEAFYPDAFKKEYNPTVDYSMMNRKAWQSFQKVSDCFYMSRLFPNE